MNLQPIATIIASVLVVGVTGYFAWHQKEIAKNKLRLDLYDRRFEIFTSIFAFYKAMISWEGTPEQREASDRFFKAYQESGFLFTKESGIEELLKMLNDSGMKAIGIKELIHHHKSDPTFTIERHKMMTDIHLKTFSEGLEKLRQAMHPYLDFSRVL